ncbi:MAG: Gfo/Idh/MocA family oxidoreductase [Opitutus sp.]|nr:Gfo/Idh/MocA family oxidoreductase [Opitutus sp.]
MFTRRQFLKSATAASVGSLAFPYIMRSQQGQSPNNKLNIACIGVGGRGRAAVAGLKDQNFIAFADVDDDRAAKTYTEFPDVPHYRDYRKLLEKHSKEIDAVTVSTPDHMHFPIAMAAIALGKHVFVEKPMTHTIEEARLLAAAARGKKVATQMGNQGHANEGMRLLKEWFEAGILGEVREVHSWTNRPIWPQGVKKFDHSKMMPVVPSTLDWDLWLGVAAAREYDPAYMPFNWRGYWDFGTGALGDMGCHIMDGAYWALGLTAPVIIEATSAHQTQISPPTASVVSYQFPAQGVKPALKWIWYDGGMTPPRLPQLEDGRNLPDNGTLVVGSKATVFADTYYASVRFVPETAMQELAPSLPAKTIPRIVGGHFNEWVNACKGGVPAGSNFDHASRITETVLLSNVAVRAQRRIEWNSADMKVINYPAANEFITKQYRPGHVA